MRALQDGSRQHNKRWKAAPSFHRPVNIYLSRANIWRTHRFFLFWQQAADHRVNSGLFDVGTFVVCMLFCFFFLFFFRFPSNHLGSSFFKEHNFVACLSSQPFFFFVMESVCLERLPEHIAVTKVPWLTAGGGESNEGCWLIWQFLQLC